ncbi:hypothetical protein [Hydrocarboniphaga sp.]|uniref:hypothetical protein n=1 Tax=Hydrocarboniphaga sp. TaxID=2033016 RepID=UPI003D12D50D
MDQEDKVREAADQIVELSKEAEAASHASTDEASLQGARAVLQQWITEASGVVVNTAFGRVTLIHGNGQASTIASSELAFRMSAAGISQL